MNQSKHPYLCKIQDIGAHFESIGSQMKSSGKDLPCPCRGPEEHMSVGDVLEVLGKRLQVLGRKLQLEFWAISKSIPSGEDHD